MRWWMLAAVVTAGCTFDSSGLGDGSGGVTGSGGSNGDDATGGTDDASSGAEVDGGPGPPQEDSGPGDTSAGDDATGGDCPMPFKQIVDVDAATVAAPMEVVMDATEGNYARSEIAEMGEVTFPIYTPCPGEFFFWGRVFDTNPGAAMFDPDSFYFSVDTEPEASWRYGCDTSGSTDSWTWQRVHDGDVDGDCSAVDYVVVNLPAGTHAVRIRNWEEAWFMDHAGVARIMVTNDAAYVPSAGE